MVLTERLSTRRGYVVTGLGIGQILSWGSTFYLLAVLAEPLSDDTGWPISRVVAGVSVGLMVAGLCSPRIGTLVAGNHGRSVLVASALLFAVGLAVLGFASNQWWYFGSWMIIGLGMSGGLYSGAFAVLGHTYGASARSAITLLTLFGGFASSFCWPLSTLLVNEVGWRWTALTYAAAHLVITVPLYLFTIPRRPSVPPPEVAPVDPNVDHAQRASPPWGLVILIATISTLGTSISAMMSIHIFTLLAGIGIAGTAAVVLAATIGPAQVGARVVELLIGRKHHPLWTMLLAMLAIAVSLGFLGLGILAPALLVVMYGVGIGLNSIANGTVPLALIGQEHYARIMGRIALPSMLAQAAAPIVGSVLTQQLGPKVTLTVLGVVAFVAFALALWLLLIHRSKRGAVTT